MRRVIASLGGGARHARRRVVGAAVLSAAVVAVMVDPGPAHAATIPTPPTSKAVCSPTPSPGNPTMTSFALTPGSVNVKAKAKTITFTVKANDTKPIVTVFVTATSPKIKGVQRSTFASLTLKKGTKATNGTWTGKATIPVWTNNGTWNITQVYLADKGGGFAFYAPTGGSKPWNNAWPKTFSVTSTPDVVPPVVKSVSVSPSSVSTTSKPKTVKVTAKITDNLSGVSGAGAFATVTVGKHTYSTGGALKRTKGTAKNGTWTGTMPIQKWVGSGSHKWNVTVQATDMAFNTSGPKNGSFKVTSKTDATSPKLKSFTFAPKSVDSHATPKGKNVAVTLKASDTLSGVAYGQVTFTSPSGFQSSGFLSRSAGTAFSGTWKAIVNIPRCSESGTWTGSVTLIDVAGNQTKYTSAQLKAKGYAINLKVTALDIQAPSASVPATVSHTGPIVVTFSEATLWSGSTNPFTVTDESTFSNVGGTWTCKNTGGTVVGCNANGADVKTASFAPSSPLTVGHKYDVNAFGGIYDTSGNGPTYVFATTKAT